MKKDMKKSSKPMKKEKMKHMDEKQDMKMMKSKVKKSCMK